MLRRGTLCQLVCELPGLQRFPQGLVKELNNRITTWLLPMYGYSAEEELSRVPDASLAGEPLEGRGATGGGWGWAAPSKFGQALILLSPQPPPSFTLQLLSHMPRRRAG